MTLPKKVKIVEVGARDGLQNEKSLVDTKTKIKFINLLSQTGLSVIEATSFVSAKKIPQLQDAEEVYKKIKMNPDVDYPVLIPNLQGLDNALSCNVKSIAVFTAASETFNQKNINCSIAESLIRIQEVITNAKKHHLKIRAYISCVLGCPYEGEINSKKVTELAYKLFEMGCSEISLGDTIGIGTPLKVQKIISEVTKKIPLKNIAMHFHDTYGQAIANIYASLEKGIEIFDSSVSGLGGCPYAKGATGNVATEDVIYLLNGLNIKTNINLEKLAIAGKFISEALNRKNSSKVANAILAKNKL